MAIAKKIGAAVLAFALVLSFGAFFAACGDSEEEFEGGWQNTSFTYEGTATQYSVYVPAGYDQSDEETMYPLVCFMPDATLAGSNVNSVKGQNGAKEWISDAWQAEHKCFVIVPQVDSVASDKEEMFYSEICEAVENYNIDSSRIYYTGQSMGGIAGFVINKNHPNFFAATYYVACQNDDIEGAGGDGATIEQEVADFETWTVGIENMNVIYTASKGDAKAYPGQQALQQYLTEKNTSYATVEVDPTGGDAVETAVSGMLSDSANAGVNHFFIQYTGGILASVNEDGSYNDSREHMNTWNYAYGITAVKEWLFAQAL